MNGKNDLLKHLWQKIKEDKVKINNDMVHQIFETLQMVSSENEYNILYLPTQYEINEYAMMNEFAEKISDVIVQYCHV